MPPKYSISSSRRPSPKAEGVKPRVEVTAGICTVCEVRSTLKRSSVSVKHKGLQPGVVK